MAPNGFGIALKTLRQRRTLSGRELSALAALNHAYEFRLEVGELTKPSNKAVEKLVRALKPRDRDASILRWLAEHPYTDPKLVVHVLEDPSVSIEVFTAAAGTVHRGVRPDPATLVERARRIMEEE